MSKPLIQAENIGKKFCKSLQKSMLYGAIDVGLHGLGITNDPSVLRENEFWAVDDVSFELAQGETLGLIGPNGSGKSTLLKMLNGIFMPDKGRVTIRGKVGALIEVGSGFHPLLSGRENIYINGAILGMKKKEIDANLDSIIDFADIGDFIDAPVKHYSSGMYVRLGFSVAVHCQPDILLVDEILAVGDRDFSVKCFQKMHEIQKSGVSIILVSHSEHLIRERTQRCLYLWGGRTKFLGESEEGISLYVRDSINKKKATREGKISKNLTDKAEILNVKFLNKDFEEIREIISGEELNIHFDFKIKESLTKPIFGVNFYGEGNFMYSANSDYEGADLINISPGAYSLQIKIPEFHLPINKYTCSAVIAEDNPTNLMDWHDSIYTLIVSRPSNARGALKLKTIWTIRDMLDSEQGIHQEYPNH